MEIKNKNIRRIKGDYIDEVQLPSLFEFPVLDGIEAARWDQYSIVEKNIESRLLMGWAGYALFISMTRKSWFINSNHIHIFAGSGNNGGDGYVLAWHILSSTNKKVTIWQLSLPATPDSDYFFKLCSAHELRERVVIKQLLETNLNINSFNNGDLIVDAVFGIGLNKAPSELIQDIFKQVNAINDVIRIAIDIPSGVYANGDFFTHSVFQAHYTYSFGSYKIGQLLEPGILSCGELIAIPIGFFPYDFGKDPQSILKNENYNRRILKFSEIPSLRKSGSHKYDSGVITILGGSVGMEGAALMAAQAFLSLGGGLAKIYSLSNSMKKSLLDTPELMIQTFDDTVSLEKIFLESLKSNKQNIAVIGVGLKETLSEDFWRQLLSFKDGTVIIDGSGLGQLNDFENYFKKHLLNNLMLTPHFAEAEKLLGKKITNVRLAALEISKRYNAHVYLKGPGGILVLKQGHSTNTMETTQEEVYINSKHYELSTGGTGDVLCGVIANMLCRYNSFQGIESALNVYLNAAQNIVVKNYYKKDFLTPTELIGALRQSFSLS